MRRVLGLVDACSAVLLPLVHVLGGRALALWLQACTTPHHPSALTPQTRRGQAEDLSYSLTPLHAELVPLEMIIAWLLMGLLSHLVVGT